MRKKRRIRTAERLVVAKGEPLSIEYFYDNGDRENKQLTLNVTGENCVFTLDFGRREKVPYFGILFKSESLLVTGEKRKARGAYLYDCFVRAGITFNPQIPTALIKKTLFEHWGALIDNTESTMQVPALAGWFSNEFWHKGNFPYKRTTDFPDLPILHKDLIYAPMKGSYMQSYFAEMLKFQQWQDRLVTTFMAILRTAVQFAWR